MIEFLHLFFNVDRRRCFFERQLKGTRLDERIVMLSIGRQVEHLVCVLLIDTLAESFENPVVLKNERTYIS